MTTTIRPTTTVVSRPVRADGATPRAVSVRPVQGESDVAAWARYADLAPGASLFHHPDWCTAVQRVFGHRPLHLRATRGEQTVGVLPLMEVDSLLAGRLHVSVPYGTYGGVLCDDEVVGAALAAEAVRRAITRRARVVDLRSAEATVPGFEPVEGYLQFVRALPLHPNEVSASLPKRARAAGRHARDRDGVVIRHDVALAPTVWHLYCRSMRRIGSINYPYRFFAELIEQLGPRAWVSVAWQGDRPVCGTISFVYRDTIMPYILGADERVRGDGAANLLYWEVMERAVRSGLRRFDYGRSRAANTGAVGFKKNQGFTPQPLGYQRYVPPGQTAPDLRPSNPRFALARRTWTRLPLPVTRLLGTWLTRSIPG